MANQTFSAGRYANIVYDKPFKLIVFKRGNEDLLIGILNLLIPDKNIVSLSFDDKEQHGESVSDKSAIFDVFCTSDNGEQFIVEMQNSEQDAFTDRMLCYANYPIRAQLSAKLAEKERNPASVIDYRLKPVYVVSLLNFAMQQESGSAVEHGMISRYDLRNAGNGELMTDALHFVYLELDRLSVDMGEPQKCTTLLQQFAYSVKYMHRLKEMPKCFDNELLERLYSASEFANMTLIQQREYEETMRTILDDDAIKEFAWKKGLKEGREKGMAEGLAEGRAKGRAEGIKLRSIEIAKQMLAKGISPETVAECTGLTAEEINGLCD